MNLEQIVKETVAKIVAEKELTAAEEKKREEIVKAMKKDFKGPAPAMYAIATDKAKKLAEDGIDEAVPTDERFVHYLADENVLNTVKYKLSSLNQSILSNDYVFKHDTNVNDEGDVVIRMYAKPRFVPKNPRLAENEDHEVSMAQSSLNSILRSAMELKAKIGNQEINIPAWIQDHITNSENFIDQASQGYHEYSNGGHEGEEMNEGYNFEQSAIESASGDKITGTEEDDYGTTLYIGQDPYDQYFIINGEIKHDNFQKGIKNVTIGMLKHYGDGQNHSVDDDMYEAFQPKSSFDDYKIGDNVTVAGKKAKITNMKMDDESGERRARVRFEDGTTKEISINTIDENTMTTNEGRSAEDLKQGQLDQAYDHLEKIKEKPKLFSSEDIKKAEARIEKLEAELDALAAKATNESLDEATVRRWQHYAGIK